MASLVMAMLMLLPCLCAFLPCLFINATPLKRDVILDSDERKSTACPKPGFLTNELMPGLEFACDQLCHLMPHVKGSNESEWWRGPPNCKLCCEDKAPKVEDIHGNKTTGQHCPDNSLHYIPEHILLFIFVISTIVLAVQLCRDHRLKANKRKVFVTNETKRASTYEYSTVAGTTDNICLQAAAD